MFSRETRLGAPRGARGGPVKDSSKVPVYGRVYRCFCHLRLPPKSPIAVHFSRGWGCCVLWRRRSSVVCRAGWR
jgi:hypothetical protein